MVLHRRRIHGLSGCCGGVGWLLRLRCLQVQVRAAIVVLRWLWLVRRVVLLLLLLERREERRLRHGHGARGGDTRAAAVDVVLLLLLPVRGSSGVGHAGARAGRRW